MRVYRVQDAEGRGPYRPGMSSRWVDKNDELPPPDWITEFGAAIMKDRRPDEFVGCGVRDLDQLSKWFSPTEMPRLRALGYRLVAMNIDRILAQSTNQIVFARTRPLNRSVTIVRFPDER
jgi:hypothetical protein